MIDYLIDNKILEPSLVASTLKCFTLNVIDTYDVCDAQVIRGGISLQEIDYNLKLKNYPHIYVLGEAMDIDGKCGGYNLLYAFACGILVAKELIKIENKN